MLLVTKFYRGSIVESFHIGYAAAVDQNNNLIFAAGDAEYPIFIRSAAKPFQAVAVLESGAVEKYGLSDEEIAIMCASHNGENYHTEAVANILKKLGLSIDNMQCGIHPPLDKSSYEQMILKGRRATPLHNACSGKHAGMLALSKALDVVPGNYNSLTHPVQEKIYEKIKHYAERTKIPVAIDDCNVPTFFIPLKNLALMYRKLIEGSDEYLSKILHIMSLHPRYIAGRGRFDTEFNSMMKVKGVTKLGGEGVRGIGIRTEDDRYIGIALKVLSGNKKAVDSMSVAVLKHLKLIDTEITSALDSFYRPVIKNHSDVETGHIETEIVAEMPK
jgi:L-asparaginase II